MDITIRPMKGDDWKLFQGLNADLFRSDSRNIGDLNMAWPKSKDGIAYYKKVAKGEKGYKGYIAEHEGKAIGYVALKKAKMGWRKGAYVEIMNINVLKPYRTKGIGTKLMETAEVWAKKQKVKRLSVSAFAKNTKAIAFYQKAGFAAAGIDLEKTILKG